MATTSSVSKAFAPAEDAPTSSQRDLDWAIVQQVQAGNVGAFDQLVQKYREQIFSVIYNMTSNREDASDLTQDAFIKAFQAIGRFQGKSAFFTWLYRIAINTTMTFLKKRGRRRFINYENINEEAHSSEIVEKLTAKNRSEKGAIVQELQEKLNESLQRLSLNIAQLLFYMKLKASNMQKSRKSPKLPWAQSVPGSTMQNNSCSLICRTIYNN